MSRFFLSIICSSFLILSSCGGASEGSEEMSASTESEDSLPKVLTRGTTVLDLSEYFMPFSMYVPDSNRGLPEINETSYGETEVRVGKTFHLIMAEGGDLNEKKTSLAEDLMYTVEIIEEDSTFVFYKSSIKDSHLEPEYHFYAVKSINGVDYEFHDFDDEGGYAESVAKFMLESVNHIIPNNSAI